MRDDFFVLWRDHDGGSHKTWLRSLVVAIFLASVGLGAGLAALQGTVDQTARFEYGTTRDYEGVLLGAPVPLLVTTDRVYFLVDPLKHAFDSAAQAQLRGRRVRLTATLIERGEQAMLEVAKGSVEDCGAAAGSSLDLGAPSQGVVLRGEIVDSKCYLGVMNPGHLKPHRACAVNCLRGGIPPLLLTRHSEGSSRQILLVSSDGAPLRDWILPFVAEPVEVSGRLQRVGPLDVLEIERPGVRRVE